MRGPYGLTPTQATQVRDDPSSTLEGLEEDEEITAEPHTHMQISDSLSQPTLKGNGLRENKDSSHGYSVAI